MKLCFCLIVLAAFVALSVQDHEELSQSDRQLRAIEAVYNMTIYPHNNYIIQTGILPDVLADNVKARVYDFAVKLEGPLSVAEYFYGLTPNDYSTAPPTIIISGVDFQHFMSKGNFAWTSINYVISLKSTGQFLSNSTQVAHWRFNDDDKIVEIDAFQPYYDIGFREGVPDSAYPFYRAALIDQACNRHQNNCLGANKQYANYTECSNFLYSLPFGSPGMNWWNSGVCRWWHSILTLLRPEVHCPHVGPSGGGVCVDFTAASLYTPFFPNANNRIIGPSHFVASLR